MTLSITQFLFIYILGGITFIPLCLALAWYTLPRFDSSSGPQQASAEATIGGEDNGRVKAELKRREEELSNVEGNEDTVTGTFAVLRKYDFPAAAAALSIRHGTHNAAATGSGTDGLAEGGAPESATVYQSMYRSVFDRSTRTSATSNARLNDSEGEVAAIAPESKGRRRAPKPASVNTYFIVLRHGHLMLYDSPAQLEVRHVISIAHHRVSLSDGVERGGMQAEDVLSDGDLFIKRTAIVLTPLSNGALGSLQAQELPAPRPFYLFTSVSIIKESFYHALLLATPSPPTPHSIDPHDLIKLQTTLHSTVITPETRALNAVLSRIFLAISRTSELEDFFRAKVEKKISRVQKPGFINSLALQAIDMGTAAPIIAKLRLQDLNISGDTTISCDVRYSGGISLTLAAQAKLDLGPRFKTRTVDLLMSSSLKRLSGHMLIRIKPPPSNRLWFCFDGLPDMEIKIEPVVSSRQITYGFILRQIEERIRSVVADTLVKPNWDDISFFDTRTQSLRAGIWADEGFAALSTGPTPAVEALSGTDAKAISMPSLPNFDPDAEGTSSATDTPHDSDAELKRRSVVSLPAQSSTPQGLSEAENTQELGYSVQHPRPLRSPSIALPSASAPSVALDDSSANFDPSNNTTPQRTRTWGRRHAPPPPALDSIRGVMGRNTHGRDSQVPHTSSEALNRPPTASNEVDGALETDLQTLGRSATGFSTASGSTASSRTESAHQKRASNLLAAATNATTAAKDWGWKTIQARAAKNVIAKKSNEQLNERKEPFGRGQPLPPPGQPLPGPPREKSLWAGSAFGVPGLAGSMKRKPVSRRGTEHNGQNPEAAATGVEKPEEFGDWKENSGNVWVGGHANSDTEALQQVKIPPPLPKRPRTVTRDSPAVQDVTTGEASLIGASLTQNVHPADITPDLPAEPVSPHTLPQSSETSQTNSDDLVVVAAPVGSGRNTPTPPSPQKEKGHGARGRDAPPTYDGNEWGGYDDDDDEYDDDEGIPKASFSRSRGDGEDLHL